MNAILDNLPILLMILTSLCLVFHLNWRWTVAALSLQYIGVFWLASQSLPLGLAAAKLVVGWMAGAILAASQVNLEENNLPIDLSGRVFRILATLFAFIVVFSIEPQVVFFLPIEPTILTGGLILLAAGLMQMGLTAASFRLIIGLLTFISGFEIIYAGLVTSVLVVGLLGVITLGLAMAGSYFILAAGLEEQQ